MSRTFIFILLMLLPLTSRSQTVEWDGVVYEIDTTIGEAKVVKVTNITQKEYPIQESFVLGGHTYPVTSIYTKGIPHPRVICIGRPYISRNQYWCGSFQRLLEYGIFGHTEIRGEHRIADVSIYFGKPT